MALLSAAIERRKRRPTTSNVDSTAHVAFCRLCRAELEAYERPEQFCNRCLRVHQTTPRRLAPDRADWMGPTASS